MFQPASSALERHRQLSSQGVTRQPCADNPSTSVLLVPDIDTLYDSFIAVYNDILSTTVESRVDCPSMDAFIHKFKPTIEFLNKARINKTDFEVIERLGQGYFGEVLLVRDKSDGALYALKRLSKGRISNLDYFMEERDILAKLDSPFLTSLYAAFQDQEHLYLAMEYLPGGDLMGLLDNRENGQISEVEAKFYAAQLIAAVEALHQAGYIHRDIKPNNVLIARDGNIKLADFGSCAKVGPDLLIRSQVSVGTPDYVSPEVLESQNNKNAAYGLDADWWGVGIVLYEMIFGTTPFTHDLISVTYSNIMMADGNVQFPDDAEISEDTKNLINSLLTKSHKRLGKGGANELKSHPYFSGINWDDLVSMTPPFVPDLESETDTKYFQLDEDLEPLKAPDKSAPLKKFKGEELQFVGYSYVRRPAKQGPTPLTLTARPVSATLPMAASATGTIPRQSQAEKQLESYKANETSLKDKIKSMESLMDELRSSENAGKAQLTQAQARISELESCIAQQPAIAAVAAKAADWSNTQALKTLEQELAVTKTVAQAASDEARDLKLAHAHTKSELSSMKEELESTKLKLETEQGELKQTQYQLQVAKDELAANVVAMAKSESEFAGLTRQLTTVQEDLNRAHAQIKQQSAEMTALSIESTKFQVELQSVRLETQEHAAHSESEFISLSKDLVSARGSLSDERARVRELQEEISSSQGRCLALSTRVTELETKLGSETQLVNDLRANAIKEAERRYQDIEQLNARITILTRQIDVQDTLATEQESSFALVAAMLIQWREALRASSMSSSSEDLSISDIDKIVKELKLTVNAKLVELESRNQESQQLVTELQSQMSSSQAMWLNAQSSLATKNAELDTASKQLDEFRKLNQQLSNDIEKLKADHDTLTKSVSAGPNLELGDASLSETKNNRRLKGEYRDLQQRFQDALSKLENSQKELFETKEALATAQTQLTLALQAASPISMNTSPTRSRPSNADTNSEHASEDSTSSYGWLQPFRRQTLSSKNSFALSMSKSPTAISAAASVTAPSPIPSSSRKSSTLLPAPPNRRGLIMVPKRRRLDGWKTKFLDIHPDGLYLFDSEKEANIPANFKVANMIVNFNSHLFVVNCVSATPEHRIPIKHAPKVFEIRILDWNAVKFMEKSALVSLQSILSTPESEARKAAFISQKQALGVDELEIEIHKLRTKIDQNAKIVDGAKRMLSMVQKTPFDQAQELKWMKNSNELHQIILSLLDLEDQFETLVQMKLDLILGDQDEQPTEAVRKVVNSDREFNLALLQFSLMKRSEGAWPVARGAHFFTLFQTDVYTVCRQCHLPNERHQPFLRCYLCQHVCHVKCCDQVHLTCDTIKDLNKETPQYFQCTTSADKVKWARSLHWNAIYQIHQRPVQSPTSSPSKDFSCIFEDENPASLSSISALSDTHRSSKSSAKLAM